MSNYESDMLEFCKINGVKIHFCFMGKRFYFPDDNAMRNVYKATICRNGKRMSVDFGDSVYNTEHGISPTPYDVLACLEKYDPAAMKISAMNLIRQLKQRQRHIK